MGLFAPLVGAIASIGSGLLGASSAKKAIKQQDANWAQVEKGYGDVGSVAQWLEGFDDQTAFLMQALGLTEKMVGDVGKLGAAAEQGILDREKLNTGQMRASMVGRGLGGTTVQDNLQRGIYADTERALLDTQEAYAGLGLQAQGQQYNALQAIASSIFAQSQVGSAAAGSKANLYSNKQIAPPATIDLSGLASSVVDIGKGLGIG